KLSWTKLIMSNLWMSDRRRRLFLAAFDPLRFVHEDIEYLDKITNTDVGVCPFVALASDWDAYLTKLSANNRQKIRRWLRKVESGQEYDIAASNDETFARDIDILLGFWKTKWA